jgi:hypothetical protein
VHHSLSKRYLFILLINFAENDFKIKTLLQLALADDAQFDELSEEWEKKYVANWKGKWLHDETNATSQ